MGVFKIAGFLVNFVLAVMLLIGMTLLFGFGCTAFLAMMGR
jgi:hypothetical protein